MPSASITSSGGTIVSANYKRIGIIINNTDTTSNLHFSFGETAATTNDAYIVPGGTLSISDYRIKHKINGISSSTTITVKYSEVQQ